MKLSFKNSAKPGVVTSLTGTVRLHIKDEEPVTLTEGIALPPEGQIELSDEASIRIFHNGKFFVFDQPGKQDLKVLAENKKGLLRGFVNYFDDSLQAVVKERGVSRDKDSGGGSGIGWGRDKDSGGGSGIGWGRDKDSGGGSGIGWGRDKDSGGGTSSGWGKITDKTKGVSPKSSPVSDNSSVFLWTRTEGEHDYVFRLFKKGDDKAVLEKKEKDIALIEIDLSELDAVAGDTLYWQVQAGEESTGSKFDFTISDGKKKQNTLEKLSGETIYQEAVDPEQLIMQAVALDRAELTHDAMITLAAALAKYPENRFVQQMTESYYDYLLYK